MKILIYSFVFLAVVGLMGACNSADKPKTADEKPVTAENLFNNQPSIQRDPKDTAKVPDMPKENPFANTKFELKVTPNADNSWGYAIWREGDDHAYIIQPHKPGVSGIRGFNTKEQATKAGNFVIHKIRQNTGMPRVTPQELDSLGVLN